MRIYGGEFVRLCATHYSRELRCLGGTMQEFFSNLDGLHGHIMRTNKFSEVTLPSFRCTEETDGAMTLHYYGQRPNMEHFVAGVVEGVALTLFGGSVNVELTHHNHTISSHHSYTVTLNSESSPSSLFFRNTNYSSKPCQSMIGVVTFCQAFPFHVIFDRNMRIVQLGTRLMKHIAPLMSKHGLQMTTYFDVIKPIVNFDFTHILGKLNNKFQLLMKQFDETSTQVCNL